MIDRAPGSDTRNPAFGWGRQFAAAQVMMLGVVSVMTPIASAQPCGLQFDSFTPRALNSNAATDGVVRDLDPQVVNSGNGTWMTVWMEIGGIGPDADLCFSRSVDAGATWSPVAPLNTNAATDGQSDNSPRVATNGQGVWIAVWWADNAFGGPVGSDLDILFARSVDDGVSWSAPAILNTNAATDQGNDFLPRIATDRAGQWVVVWISTDSLGNTIGADRDVLVASSSDDGATWSPPAPVNHFAATDNSRDDNPELAMSATGECLAVWTSDDALNGTTGADADILGSTSFDGGLTWTTAVAVNINAAVDGLTRDGDPTITTDHKGTWLAAWSRRGSGVGLFDWDVACASSTNDGQSWTADSPVNHFASNDSDDDLFVRIATDGDGAWVAVWESEDPVGGAVGTDADILAAVSEDAGATWTKTVIGNPNAADDGQWHDRKPSVSTDGNNWVIAWQSFNNLDGTLGFEGDIHHACATISTSPDCNNNSVPDSCDIKNGSSLDLDINGVPDECQTVAPQLAPTSTVALTGDPIPGGGTFRYFVGQRIDSEARALGMFEAVGVGPGVCPWIDGVPTLIAESNQQAPGTPRGALFKPVSGNSSPFTDFNGNDDGDAVLAATLGGIGVSDHNDRGLWRSNDKGLAYVAREGDQAAGAAPGVTFSKVCLTSSIPRPRINAMGDIAFSGELIGPGVISENRGGIWRWSLGVQSLVMRWGDIAPGLGVPFSFCFEPSMDDSGQVTFAATTTQSGPDGIWRGTAGALTPLVLKGAQAPGLSVGVVFSLLDTEPLVSAAGVVVFDADLTGPGVTSANNSSIWTWRRGVLSLVAREGDPAPNVAGGELLGPVWSVSIHDDGRICYAGFVTGPNVISPNNTALWLQTADGDRLVVRSGEQAPGATPGLVFSPMSIFTKLPKVAMTNHDAVVFQARMDSLDGVWGWTLERGLFFIAVPGRNLYADGVLVGKVESAYLNAVDSSLEMSHSDAVNDGDQFLFKVNFHQPGAPLQGMFMAKLPLPGDLNNDGVVNVIDLLMTIGDWGSCLCVDCVADTDDNQSVNVSDVLHLIEHWGGG